jgi:hypothetical protein
MTLLCDGAVGTGGVIMEAGLIDLATLAACKTAQGTSSSFLHTTLESLEHLCFFAVLRDLNLCPHARHSRSQVLRSVGRSVRLGRWWGLP